MIHSTFSYNFRDSWGYGKEQAEQCAVLSSGQTYNELVGDSVNNGTAVPWTCKNLELAENKF